MKAQSQIFSYAFALVIAALVLMFGYRMIFGVSTQQDAMKYSELRSSLQADIERLSMQFGSSEKNSYSLPSGISEVCFYGPSDTDSPITGCSKLKDYPLIQDSVDDKSPNNIFLLGKSPDAFYSPYVETGICSLRCFSGRKLTATFVGRENKTLILP